MKKFFKKIKPLDILILAAVLSFVFLASLFIYTSSETKLYLIIKTPKGEWIYPMEQEADISVEGEIGITRISIKDKTATVIDSPCSNKTCIVAPGIKQQGDWNACLPNKVFLSVENR